MLTDEQLDARDDDGGESGQLGLEPVRARLHIRQAVLAVLVADAGELTTGFEIDGRHRDAGNDRLRLVGHRTNDEDFLPRRRGRKHEQQTDDDNHGGAHGRILL